MPSSSPPSSYVCQIERYSNFGWFTPHRCHERIGFLPRIGSSPLPRCYFSDPARSVLPVLPACSRHGETDGVYVPRSVGRLDTLASFGIVVTVRHIVLLRHMHPDFLVQLGWRRSRRAWVQRKDHRLLKRHFAFVPPRQELWIRGSRGVLFSQHAIFAAHTLHDLCQVMRGPSPMPPLRTTLTPFAHRCQHRRAGEAS